MNPAKALSRLSAIVRTLLMTITETYALEPHRLRLLTEFKIYCANCNPKLTDITYSGTCNTNKKTMNASELKTSPGVNSQKSISVLKQ